MMSRLLLMILLLIVGIGTGWAADEHAPSHWGYEGEERYSLGHAESSLHGLRGRLASIADQYLDVET